MGKSKKMDQVDTSISVDLRAKIQGQNGYNNSLQSTIFLGLQRYPSWLPKIEGPKILKGLPYYLNLFADI